MNFSIRTLIEKLHLWLGLFTAPLVFFICITGTIIVFCDEIMDFSAGDARYVNEVKAEPMETEALISILKTEFPNRWNPSYIVYYRDPRRSVRINSFGPTEGLHMVYMNQYTGEILKDDPTINFFYIVAHLHHSLLWHGPGEWIIDIGTIVFLIALITGLVLWWPRSLERKNMKKAFTFKLSGSRKRLNYDLHSVGGFYGLGLGLLLTITGLLIAFKPFSDFTQKSFGGDPEVQMRSVFVSVNDSTKTASPINEVVQQAFVDFPEKTEIQLYTYWLDDWGYYAMYVANKIGIKSAMNGKLAAYDKYSGKRVPLQKELVINEAVSNMYWTLHLGNYLGLFGKIVTFLGGLIASSLSVTGFFVWWNKRKKNRKSRKSRHLDIP
ncbi:PepSY-associated TM helix domain-containing protein [Mangrovibacterium diazotrophicum]|uniref:Putative iron-regulated membrane protein n=1 Tax=Mangrovibacterium diazotrophicum TaxID=1261403 RepID=A0A419W6H0_9BACT|nr:PepSY-associated TM helix domain-containing protein [Mangrovibacterium diazotrophicum]RKD91054.1 putative iron-regulated membrane protein [Mangrovibacterium diazotrophicum]